VRIQRFHCRLCEKKRKALLIRREKKMRTGRLISGAVLMFFVLLSFCYVGSSYAAEPAGCPSGMLHYWKLEENGAPYADLYGANQASCSICPTPTPGIIGGAQQFTAATNVNISDDGTFDWSNANSFSVELWMKTSACTGTKVLAGRDDSVTQVHWYVGCTDGIGEFVLIDNNGNIGFVSGTSTLTDGNWHHIVAVKDGANELRIYVDGAKEDSLQPLTFTGGFDSTAPLNIGWINLSHGYHFSGSLDEVALYNNVLSEAEIKQHYYDGQVGLRRGYCGCSSPVKIMPLGDSITYGDYLDDPPPVILGGYRRLLHDMLTNYGYSFDFVGSQQAGDPALFDIDHEGHGGWGAKRARPPYGGGIAPYVQTFLANNPAEVVLLHIGTNDVSDGLQNADDVAEILDNIDLVSEDITVILGRIINRTDTVQKSQATTQFNNDVEAIARNRIANGNRIIIVDHENALNYATDMKTYLHPTEGGYSKMANVWFNALRYFLPVCSQPDPPAGCPSDMLHYWKLDENSAPYMDSFGTNNATCSVCPTQTPGIINGAQQFTASTNVSVVDDGTFDWGAAQSFSVELWMKTSACTGTDVLAGRDDSTTPLHWWVGCTGSKAEAYVIDTNNTGYGIAGTTAITDGNWHHVVFVRDASANKLRIYVDGVSDASPVDATYTGGFHSTAPLNIGWINLSHGYHFSGSIDEVALYNRILSEAEIAQHYSQGLEGYNYCAGFFTLTINGSGSGSGTVTGNGINCTVTDGSAGGDCSEPYDAGSEVTLTATPDADSTFSWGGGACSGTAPCTVTMNGDTTVTATFSLKQYTVTPSAGPHGNISPSTPRTAEHGNTLQFTVTPDTGYNASVTGTCGGTLSGDIYTTNPITADCTVTASFSKKIYTITATAGPNGSITCSPNLVDFGADSICTVTSATGYHADAVTVDGSPATLSDNTYTFSNVTANHAIDVTFAINTYTVTPSAGAGGSISPNTPQTVNHGSTAQFTVTPNAGYHVDSVAGTCGGILSGNSYTTSPVTANCTVTATFAINTYAVSALAGKGGTISPAGTTVVNYGASLTFTITPDASYRIADVKVDGSSVGAAATHTFNNINANHSIDAAFVGIYSISGTVRMGRSPIAEVTVILNGPTSGTAITDSLGNYSFSGLANGSYTVTPAKSGLRFAPVSRAVIVSGASVIRQDFSVTLSAATAIYSISGTVSAEGSPLAGVTVTLSGADSGSASTDEFGNYSFTGLLDGSYTLTPSLPGFTFSPANRFVTISGTSVTGQDFTGTFSGINTYSISGKVLTPGTRLSPGLPISGVTITLSGTANGIAVTDANGNYVFTGLKNGNYTLTPGKTGYSFTPAFRSVNVNGANVTGQNFAGASQ
jgi:hypothetical protein